MTDQALTTAQSLEWFRGELLHRGFTPDEAQELTKVACIEDIRQSGLNVAVPDQWNTQTGDSTATE